MKSFSHTRKLDYWLSFVEMHRLPGVSPPRVMIIGSHHDLLKKKTPADECAGFIARLDSHIRSRLKQSRPSLDGFFAIDCRYAFSTPKLFEDSLLECCAYVCFIEHYNIT